MFTELPVSSITACMDDARPIIVRSAMFILPPWSALAILLLILPLSFLLADPPGPVAAPLSPDPVNRFPGSSKRLLAVDDDDNPPDPSDRQTAPEPSGRYEFGLLDRRSSYGGDFFPDPFIGPELDRETQWEVDYAHGESPDRRENQADAQVDWNFAEQFTLSVEAGYDSEHALGTHTGGGSDDPEPANARGFENVDVAVYHPVFEAISRGKTLDYTAVLRLDVGVPTYTKVSGTDVQLTPYLGQLLRLGEHVSVEAWTGPQFTLAPHRTNQFLYGTSLGYRITRRQLALPLTQSVTPLFELDGQQPFSRHGANVLIGVAGLNWQFAPFGELHPRVGVGYQFPVDRGGRDQLRWGIVTQLFLDF